jgi:hypothetical protein
LLQVGIHNPRDRPDAAPELPRDVKILDASKSSSGRHRLPGLRSFPADGWSNERLLGSTATAASPRTSKRQLPVPKPGCSSPPSNFSYGE